MLSLSASHVLALPDPMPRLVEHHLHAACIILSKADSECLGLPLY